MGYPLTVELPEELRQPLFKQATTVGQTPEEWVVTTLRRQLIVRDERLRKHFGAVDLGTPTGADNASIDADLAQVYANTLMERFGIAEALTTDHHFEQAGFRRLLVA